LQTSSALCGRRVLVVEDDYLIAEALVETLEIAGAVVLGPIGWAAEALAAVQDKNANFDAVLLDIDLHGEKSYAIADALAVRGMPFVLTTGYDANAIDRAYRQYPRCEKPLSERALLAALTATMQSQMTESQAGVPRRQ
jgi:DNA-binding NtrC family response regulator